MPKQDIYEGITSQILEEMETAGEGWLKPFRSTSGSMPVNHKGTRYRGSNVIVLWLAAQRLEKSGQTPSNQWISYNQAKKLGGQVRKGEKGTRVIFWGTSTKKDADTNGEEKKSSFGFLKQYTVFNTCQIDGLEGKQPLPEFEPVEIQGDELAAIMATAIDCTLSRENGRAYYAPLEDRVNIPDSNQWRTLAGFNSTVAHECSHATGSKSRLDRLKNSIFGSTDYAFEELVAELSACFVCSILGIEFDSQNSAKYLNNWKTCMKSNPTAFNKAATLAASSADYITERLSATVTA
jgi:antirestriction protein ArdC